MYSHLGAAAQECSSGPSQSAAATTSPHHPELPELQGPSSLPLLSSSSVTSIGLCMHSTLIWLLSARSSFNLVNRCAPQKCRLQIVQSSLQSSLPDHHYCSCVSFQRLCVQTHTYTFSPFLFMIDKNSRNILMHVETSRSQNWEKCLW